MVENQNEDEKFWSEIKGKDLDVDNFISIKSQSGQIIQTVVRQDQLKFKPATPVKKVLPQLKKINIFEFLPESSDEENQICEAKPKFVVNEVP